MPAAQSFPQRSDIDRAMKSMTTHSFHRGLGYVDHGAPPKIATSGPVNDTNCDPPARTKNGTRHVLASPGRKTEMTFTWVAAERAWARDGGNRMAWTAQHLSRVGWKYVRAA